MRSAKPAKRTGRSASAKADKAPSKRAAAVKTWLDAQPGSVADPAPVAGVLLYKIMGKMFAILALRGEPSVIVKCDPDLVEILREKYAGVGHRSHLDRRFWINVELEADVPLAEIKHLVVKSHALVRASLTRKQQAELG